MGDEVWRALNRRGSILASHLDTLLIGLAVAVAVALSPAGLLILGTVISLQWGLVSGTTVT